MSLEVMRILVKEITSSVEEPLFVWHGGEPLLAGVDFFKGVIRCQREFRPNLEGIKNVIQTNGVLLSSDWTELLRDGGFRIGTSLDGDKETHDLHRRDSSGAGSYDRVFSGVEILRSNKIPFGAICTITRDSVRRPRRFFSWLKGSGIGSIRITPAHGNRFGNGLDFSPNPDEFANFLVDVFDAWISLDDPGIEIGEFSGAIKILTGTNPEECIFSGRCDEFFTVDWNGDIFCCDTIAHPNQGCCFGNIADGLHSIIRSDKFRKFQDQFINFREACRSTPWFSYIKTGCMGDYGIEWGEPADNRYGPAWLKLFNHVRTFLRQTGISVVL